MDGLLQSLEWAFGLHAEPKDFTLLQVSLRSVLTYLVGLAILRLARNRFLARESAFDVVLAFIFGSVLSRAINGTTPLLLTLAASALLIAMHRAFAWMSYRWPRFERAIDGRPDRVVQDGKVITKNARAHLLNRANIEGALRLKTHLKELSEIEEACVETNGEISFVPHRHPLRVVEVKVEEGVQVIRLELS
jgi:uncharacterized membrane protein YcaP (DUF421 family)